MRIQFNGITVAQGPADGFGNYSLSFTVPAGQAPGDYSVTARDLTPPAHTQDACTLRISGAAATPTPTPTVPPTPTPRRDDVADALRDLADAIGRGGGGQQQQQEQQVVFPVAAPIPVGYHSHGGGGSSLPKTGVDAAEVGGIGTLSLLAGVSLMEFARRRRRHWLAPPPADVATEIVSDHVPAKPAPKPAMVPAVPPTRSEADLMLPYTAAREVAPQDFIAPTF